MLGPLSPTHQHEVEPVTLSPCSPLARSVSVARDKGWNVMTGKWLVEGHPNLILFDVASAAGNMNMWKHELYEKAQIGIPHHDTECNNLIIFGFMMAQFIADFKWQLSRTDVQHDDGCDGKCSSNGQIPQANSSFTCPMSFFEIVIHIKVSIFLDCCTFSRVDVRCWSHHAETVEGGCCHSVHHSRHSTGQTSVCWSNGLLQLSGTFQCGCRGRQEEDLPQILSGESCCSSDSCLHYCQVGLHYSIYCLAIRSQS